MNSIQSVMFHGSSMQLCRYSKYPVIHSCIIAVPKWQPLSSPLDGIPVIPSVCLKVLANHQIQWFIIHHFHPFSLVTWWIYEPFLAETCWNPSDPATDTRPQRRHHSDRFGSSRPDGWGAFGRNGDRGGTEAGGDWGRPMGPCLREKGS